MSVQATRSLSREFPRSAHFSVAVQWVYVDNVSETRTVCVMQYGYTFSHVMCRVLLHEG